jgi:hypothetical protein
MLLPFPGEQNIRGPLDLIRRLWRDTLAQPDPGDLAARARHALSVPFVDYARGDGRTVGRAVMSNGRRSSSATTSRGSTATRDCGASTRATGSPASVRRPVRSTREPARSASPGTIPSGSPGWARVSPPTQAVPDLEARIGELTKAHAAALAEADELTITLRRLDAEVAAVRDDPGSRVTARPGWPSCTRPSSSCPGLRTQATELSAAIAAGHHRLERLEAGQLDDPRGHLRHAAEPQPPAEARRRAYGEAGRRSASGS